LILIDPKDEIPLKTILKLYGRAAVHVFPDTPLSKMLEMFKSGKSHMAIVHDVNNDGDGDPFYEELGVITLEDIIESILQDDIVDETDVYVDIHERKKVTGRHKVDLSALGGKAGDSSKISPQELSALFHHLSENVTIFKPDHSLLTPAALRRMLASAKITVVRLDQKKRTDSKAGGVELSTTRAKKIVDIKDGGTWLYSEGQPTDYMTIILAGRAKAVAGRDGFVAEVGKWSVLCWQLFEGIGCADSKITKKGLFKPDFSAYLTTDSRVMRISRNQFVDAVRDSKREEQEVKAKDELGNDTKDFSVSRLVAQRSEEPGEDIEAEETQKLAGDHV
jgi:metal transporter CNNM